MRYFTNLEIEIKSSWHIFRNISYLNSFWSKISEKEFKVLQTM